MPSPDDTIDLVPFASTHLEGALRLSRQAAWPHRLEDWEMALALSEGVVACDAVGTVVATVLLTQYGEDAATINMVIVDEAMRGRGLGRRLMDAAMTLGGTRPLRLVATEDGLPLYRKLGFHPVGTILQHQGMAAALDAPEITEDATKADIPGIAALDRDAFGANRSGLINRIDSVGTFAVLRRNGVVDGFSAMRAFGRGTVIGPVVTRSADDAKSLVAHFIARHPQSFLRVDTTVEAGLAPWLAEQGLAHVGGGVAMLRPPTAAHSAEAEHSTARGPAERARTHTIHALANQALG